jgi:hypothetical protein
LDGKGIKALLTQPQSLAIFNDTIYVAEYYQIKTITFSGDVRIYAGNGIPGYINGNLIGARFKGINGITFDEYGNLYIADTSNNVIRKISNTGFVSTYAGMLPGLNARGFDDGNGNINLQKLM